jgi:hypothetical protein
MAICASKCVPNSKEKTDADEKEPNTPSRIRQLLHSISFNDKMQQLTCVSPAKRKSTVIRLSYKRTAVEDDCQDDASEIGKPPKIIYSYLLHPEMRTAANSVMCCSFRCR